MMDELEVENGFDARDRYFVAATNLSRAYHTGTQMWVTEWDKEKESVVDTELQIFQFMAKRGLIAWKLYKADIWMRVTDKEAETIDAVLSAAPARLRYLWQDSQFFDVTSPQFNLIRQPMVQAFGEKRANEILAAV